MQEFKTYSRAYIAHYPLAEELTLDKDKNYLFDLDYLGVIECKGDKAIDYLQGQLTCDLRGLTEGKMQRGLQCNLQGRILAIIDVLSLNGIKLIVPKDLIESTIKSLSKTAALSRVELVENNEYRVFGENEALHLIHNTEAENRLKSYKQQKLDRGSLAWHWLQLQKGQIEIYPETRGQFLPHRLGFHKTDLISFDKGCYKGQEIIARMHYRSTVKHELVYKHCMQQELEQVEELVDYCLLADGGYFAAICELV